MKYLFIAGLYPKEKEFFFKSYSRSGTIQNAPNVFQWSVVDGLEKNGIEFWVLSAPFVASFPKGFKKVIVPSYPIVSNGNVIGNTIKYLNVLGIKNLSVRNRLKASIISWIKENSIQKKDRFAIITYTPLSFFLSAVKDIKKDYPNLIVSSIVTDLIEDAHNFKVNQKLFKRIQISIERRREHQNYQVIDKFVLLSKAMVERIPEAVGKSIIVEGIAIVPDQKPQNNKKTSEKALLYTGSLHEFAGIKTLVEAFKKTDDSSFRLIICGTGQCKEYIEEEAKKDHRIVFRGNLMRSEALQEQYKATALINPRPPIEEITRFSFPSKTMEYLSSGTPMIGYRLEGIPEEYYKYFYSPNDVSKEELTETINNVLSLNQDLLNKKGEEAFEFIKSKKNSKVQIGRIINFIEK